MHVVCEGQSSAGNEPDCREARVTTSLQSVRKDNCRNNTLKQYISSFTFKG